jgi:hypothetical protein
VSDLNNERPPTAAECAWFHRMLKLGLPVETETEAARLCEVQRRVSAAEAVSRERTALHEAGHCVVAHQLGWPVAWAELLSDEEGASLAYPPALAPAPIPVAEAIALVDDQVTVGVAGYTAEQRVYPVVYPFEALEMSYRAATLLGASPQGRLAFVERCEARARTLLDENWPLVRALAGALAREGRVEGERLRAICAVPHPTEAT